MNTPAKCQACDGSGKVPAEVDVDDSLDPRGFPTWAVCGECNGDGVALAVKLTAAQVEGMDSQLGALS